MQLDEMCHPIIIPLIPTQVRCKEGETDREETSKNHTSLFEVFGDQYQKVKIRIFEEIECLEEKTAAEMTSIMEDILYEYGITENHDAVRDAMIALALRALSPALKSLGIDVAFLREEGFDKIVEEYDISNKSIFFGSYNKKDWQTIRSILKSTWNEMYELALAESRISML